MAAVCIAQWRQCALHNGGSVHCTMAAVCIAQLRQYALGHGSNAETSVPPPWQHFGQDQNILMQSSFMMAALMEHYTGRHFL
jgi:hypothetical protein